VNEPELVSIGRVGRSHGIDGAFVVERASEDERRFAVGARLLAGGEAATVQLVRRVGRGRIAIRLDRPVERGTELAIPRAELPAPDDGSYYVFQLVGLAVVEEGGRELGRIADVEPGIANDALALDNGLLLPLVEDCVRDVDLEGGRVIVAPGYVPDG
jgi:16S rRNA processing protein RimM